MRYQRIIKKDLVYIIGLSQKLAKKEILQKPQFLGQYGKIRKIIVNKDKPFTNNYQNSLSFSAYITFNNKKEASLAILSLDGYEVDKKIIKASFGMTKYCSYFVNGNICKNGDCLYLHEIADREDCFGKDEEVCKKILKVDQRSIIEDILKGGSIDGNFKDFSKEYDVCFPTVEMAYRKIRDFLKEKDCVVQIKKKKLKKNKRMKRGKKNGHTHEIKSLSKWTDDSEDLEIFNKNISKTSNCIKWDDEEILGKEKNSKERFILGKEKNLKKTDNLKEKNNKSFFFKKSDEDVLNINDNTSLDGKGIFLQKSKSFCLTKKNNGDYDKKEKNKNFEIKKKSNIGKNIEILNKDKKIDKKDNIKNEKKHEDKKKDLFLKNEKQERILGNLSTKDTLNFEKPDSKKENKKINEEKTENKKEEENPKKKTIEIFEPEIETVLKNRSNEFTELDKKIINTLKKSFKKLQRKNSRYNFVKNTKKEEIKIIKNIKDIIKTFLEPNSEIFKGKNICRRIKKNIYNNDCNEYRLFDQSYTLKLDNSKF